MNAGSGPQIGWTGAKRQRAEGREPVGRQLHHQGQRDGTEETANALKRQKRDSQDVKGQDTSVAHLRQLLEEELSKRAALGDAPGLGLLRLPKMFKDRFGYDLDHRSHGFLKLSRFVHEHAGDLVVGRVVTRDLVLFPVSTVPQAASAPSPGHIEARKEDTGCAGSKHTTNPGLSGPAAQEHSLKQCGSTTDEHLPEMPGVATTAAADGNSGVSVSNEQLLLDFKDLVSRELGKSVGGLGVPAEKVMGKFWETYGYTFSYKQFGFDRLSLFLKARLGDLVLVKEDRKKNTFLLPVAGAVYTVSHSSSDDDEDVKVESMQEGLPNRGQTVLEQLGLLLRQKFLDERLSKWRRVRDRAVENGEDAPNWAALTLEEQQMGTNQVSKSCVPEDTSGQCLVNGMF